jgi:hypothetical protein
VTPQCQLWLHSVNCDSTVSTVTPQCQLWLHSVNCDSTVSTVTPQCQLWLLRDNTLITMQQSFAPGFQWYINILHWYSLLCCCVLLSMFKTKYIFHRINYAGLSSSSNAIDFEYVGTVLSIMLRSFTPQCKLCYGLELCIISHAMEFKPKVKMMIQNWSLYHQLCCGVWILVKMVL